MKMDLINKCIAFLIIFMLYNCSKFETKLSKYMEKDMPSCVDTTYWRLVDLQDVLGVKFDRLYIIASEFEEDIAKGTKTDWKDGDYISWEKDLLLLAKGNNVVFKDEIDKGDLSFYAFDKEHGSNDTLGNTYSECPLGSCRLFDTSTLYYIRVDIIKGKSYYTLYNKYRMEHGKAFFESHRWLLGRDKMITPWGQGLPQK